MKKTVKKIFVTMLALAMVLTMWAGIGTTAKAAGEAGNSMNVVFVLDGSGSMKRTDPDKLRNDAVDLFMGLSTESGNYMGAVIFDDTILLQKDIQLMDGKRTKQDLSDSMRQITSSGDTDIGTALELATDMLASQGNKSLPSVIILLSDGATDFSSTGDKDGSRMAASLENKNDAISNARSNKIPVYSVCLNTAGNEASLTELQEISDATGGKCVEVTSAEDLKDVFSMFYNMIYSTETVGLFDGVIGDSGELDVPFTIPVIGVQEANIIISTVNPNTSFNLKNPDSYGYTQSELDDMAVKAKTFTVIKIQDPKSGQWVLTVRGVPGDKVRIDMVSNSDLSLELTENGGVATAKLYNAGKAIDDDNVYNQCKIVLKVTDKITGQVTEVPMSTSGGAASVTVDPKDMEEYSIQAVCKVDDLELISDTLDFVVGNSAPTVKKSQVTIHKVVSPFTKDPQTIDVADYFKDADGDPLTFTITSSDFDKNTAYLDNDQLLVNIKKSGNGKIQITAADPKGQTAVLTVKVSTTSFLVFVIPVLVAAIAIAVVIIIFRMNKDKKIPIVGRITIVAFDDENGGSESPDVIDGGRGRLYLNRYMYSSNTGGIDRENSYFLGSGSNGNILFISKNGYYTESDPNNRRKEIRIPAGMEVLISDSNDLSRGIRVSYDSFDNGMGY